LRAILKDWTGMGLQRTAKEHDPEKWEPVFGKDHAQAKC
jgi:hypothetical protein